ncbi:hypothetical protein KIN20_015247 [Parelaphostrongylus tenuis]|uniref:Uncharacterized protein n=1 Tax=Parelaphostrongylus tenuis TaxID=148309 RepID=A0AAD5MX38_PARTN|nr:hypothetical protein KIN20_015247 [Parelaphostrongylus tenuis]
MDDDYDESRERKSRKCSRCSPLKKLPFGANVAATIRYDTLLNGCLQAIISCPTTAKHLAVIGSVSEDQGEMILTELAVGTGIQVVAQCRKDRKYHANSEEGTDVILDGIECFSLAYNTDVGPRQVPLVPTPKPWPTHGNNTHQGPRQVPLVPIPEPRPPHGNNTHQGPRQVPLVPTPEPRLPHGNNTHQGPRQVSLVPTPEPRPPHGNNTHQAPVNVTVMPIPRPFPPDDNVADGSGSDDERFLTSFKI